MGKTTMSSQEAMLKNFDQHAVAIAKRQYFTQEDKDLAGMFHRVASWVASPEEGNAKEQYTKAFYELMISKHFCPGGRVLAGAATNHGNVLNCFVQDGSPEHPGSNSWVLHLARKLALVTKVGGGNGLCLDPILPKRAYTKPVGQLYLTIAPEHPDYEKVKAGTYMDLVHGKYVTKGYRYAAFIEQNALPTTLPKLAVGDAVEKIWQSGADMVLRLLKGEDVLLDLTPLRPEGTPVRGSGGNSSGPSSFAVEVFDNFAFWASLGGAEYAGPVATLRYIFAPTLRVIRQGGCLHPDTLVHTSKGTLRLKECVDAYHYGWQDHHLHVATDEGWKESPQGFNNGMANTLKVGLENGLEVQGTANHKLKVLNEQGERVWKELGELKKGDWVIQVLDQHTGSAVMLRPLDGFYNLSAPEMLNEDLSLLLGYIWGQGVIKDRLCIRVQQDSPMRETLPVLFKDLFDLELSREDKGQDVVFASENKALLAWLKQNNLVNTSEIPRAIRQASRPMLAAFLRGLFEANGRLEDSHLKLHHPLEQLSRDVAVLLAGLGIVTRLSQQAGVWSVQVMATGHEQFVTRIGAMSTSRLEAIKHSKPAKQEANWPKAAARHLEAVNKGGSSAWQTRPSRSTEPLAEHYVQVEKIESAGRILTLDISVNENKTYLANAFVSHNTRRGAGMATMSITHPDIQDFITAKDLEREQVEGDISTFNISVLVSDSFMQKSKDGEQGTLKDIADHAWQTGEPGLIYIDRINEHNAMQEALGDIKSTNPCVTADTWVSTHLGPKQVKDLVGQKFCALVDGKPYASQSQGFWSTGIKPVYKVLTKKGFELRLTGNHKLKKILNQTRYKQESAWTELENLTVGDSIALQNHQDVMPWQGRGNYIEGWLLGSLVGDGTFVTDKKEVMACLEYWGDQRFALADLAQDGIERVCESGKLWVSKTEAKLRISSSALAKLAASYDIFPGHKVVSDKVEQASYDFYLGFLSGLFDADGSVQGNQEKGVSIRLAQSNSPLLKRVQRMLARLGMLSSIYKRRPAGKRMLPDGKGGLKEYACQAQYELVLAKENVEHFHKQIRFEVTSKQASLNKLIENYQRKLSRERFVDEIVAITPQGKEEVFDVTIEHIHAFDANGISAHNCGEIPLYAGEPCDLGAINLAAYVKTPGKGTEGFNWDGFKKDVKTCIRFLDNVLDVNKFALEDNRKMSRSLRRLGLGVMGLADALIQMGYRYNSEEGRQAVAKMIGALRESATIASEELAKERGVFPRFKESGLAQKRRNVALLTVAPTGTTSMLMGVSSGVEPVFAPFVYRKIGDSYASLIHPLFQDLLDQHKPHPDYTKEGAWDWDKVVEAVQNNHGSVQGLAFVPEEVKSVLVCAHDISPSDHVKMQGVVQSAFDAGGHKVANSISKTINLPNQASVDDVFEAYSLAFTTGCKGITVYRDGSRQFQVLSTKKEKEEKAVKEAPAVSKGATDVDHLPGEPLFDRPSRLSGFTDTVKLMLPSGEQRGFYVTVNTQDGLPSEVFIISGKAGDEANADSEALGRMVSIALQYGVPAEAIVKTLRGISGGMYGTYQGRMVASKADLLAVALETAGTENVLNKNKSCPDCSAPLRFEEGCQKCESCGYSKCG